MKKIIFTSPIFGYPPCGGPQLRIFNSAIALSKITNTHFLFQNYCKELDFLEINNKYENFLNKKLFLFPNDLPYPIWRITTIISKYIPKAWKNLVNIMQARQILKYAESNDIDVIWFGYGNISLQLIKNIRKMSSKIKIVCDTDSVWSRFILRRIKYEKNPKIRSLIRKKGLEKIIEEKKITQVSDIVTAVSDVDKKYYEKIAKNKTKIRIFPNVINVSDYEKIEKVTDIPKNKYIYLSGSFGYKSPMEDAAIWFLDKIMPEVWKVIPQATVLIVGTGAKTVLSKYLNKRSIYIKDSVRSTLPYLKNAKVSVVPLRYESGTRFKILEAGICSVPVVSTTLGAEGLDVTDGENIKIANTPKKFAESIVEIMEKPQQSQTIKLLELIREKYTLKSLIKHGKNILELLD